MEKTRLELGEYRLKRAKGLLEEAEILLKVKKYRGVINRGYYAAFSAIRSLLALIGLDSAKHSGVISLFDRYFIKEGYLEKSLSKIIHGAFEKRQDSDYGDFTTISKEEAEDFFKDIGRFLKEVSALFTSFANSEKDLLVVKE